jgi:hypothetical protein
LGAIPAAGTIGIRSNQLIADLRDNSRDDLPRHRASDGPAADSIRSLDAPPDPRATRTAVPGSGVAVVVRDGLRDALTVIVLLGAAVLVAACADDEVQTPPATSSALATVAPASLVPSLGSAIASLGPPPNGSPPVTSALPASDGSIGTLAPPVSGAPTSAPTGAPSAAASVNPPSPTPTPFIPPTPTPTPSIANGIDPCALVSATELQGITGHPVLDTSRLGPAVQPIGCRWEFDSGQAGQTFELTLGVTSPGGAQAFASAEPFAAENTPLPSLGDGAFSVVGNTIFVVQGDTMLDIQYLASAKEKNRFTVPVQVLQLVLTRLPAS